MSFDTKISLLPEQLDIIQWAVNGQGSASINAVAGSGKTTTLLFVIKQLTSQNTTSVEPLKIIKHPKYPWVGVEILSPGTVSPNELKNLHKTLSLPMGNKRNKKEHVPVWFEFPERTDGKKWVYKLKESEYQQGLDKIENWISGHNQSHSLCSDTSILYLAFNRSVVAEVQEKKFKEHHIPGGVECKTFHSFGNQLISSLGKFSSLNVSKNASAPVEKDNYKKKKRIIESILQNYQDDARQNITVELLIKATCLAQNYGLSSSNVREEFNAENSDGGETPFAYELIKLSGPDLREEQLVEMLEVILEDCQIDHQKDFEDMIWLPTICDVPLPRYDWILIDEAQDLNPCQIKLMKKIHEFHPETRFLMVGDPDQAIYGFRGADAHSFANLASVLDIPESQEFPLNGCRRCTPDHVDLASKCTNRLIRSLRENEEGEIRFMSKTDIIDYFLVEQREPNTDTLKNDLILSRKNKPLVKMAYNLMKEKKSISIIGEQELFQMMLQLITNYKKSKSSIPFESFVKEQQKIWVGYAAKRQMYSRITFLQEYYGIVLWLFKKSDENLSVLLENISNLMKNEDTLETIYFSSTHRAKGDEARNIWILDPNSFLPYFFEEVPLRPSEMEQELHCLYVALTRCCGITITFERSLDDENELSVEYLLKKIDKYNQVLEERKEQLKYTEQETSY